MYSAFIMKGNEIDNIFNDTYEKNFDMGTFF